MATATFPALLDQASQTLYPLRAASSFLVGRNETADVCVLDPTCSRHHFRIVRIDGQYHVEALAAHNPTWCDGRLVIGRLPLQHEAVLQAGQKRFVFLLRPPGSNASGTRPSTPGAAAARPAGDIEQTIAAGPELRGSAVLGQTILLLPGTMILGRDPDQVQIPLPHPQVSRRHAQLVYDGQTAVLKDFGSANGTFVNGARLAGPATLRAGDQVDIGPYALEFTGAAFIPRPRSDNAELVARGLCRTVTDRQTGQPLTLLDDITLVVRPREFLCLLGPSGSGKTTLLGALSGRTPPDRGEVLLNGQDLFAHFEALKQDMVVVPQKDVLHESLRVGQALWYTARLRLPPDTSPAEIEACLTDLLETVGLEARRGTAIRHLSGGQVKRASLANEILCGPSLLFLDEVTSGLDEQSDREMMDLFRCLADAGKTVVCITHSLANVERACHLVLILAPGGKLAFVGKPAEALAYFRIDRLGDVYQRLADHPAEHWQRAFRVSPYYARYVAERLPAPAASPAGLLPVQGGEGERLRRFFRQAGLLGRRYLAVWLGDWPALLAMAGQALLVAVLLGVLFGHLGRLANPVEHGQRTVNLLFLLAVSCFWFGCNNAAKEIVKERHLYARERDFNLLPGSYYASKLFLLLAFSGLQAILLYAMVRPWCGLPGPATAQLVVLLALTLAGVTLGLAISAASPTEEMAVTLIPVAVIPQIILSGVIAPLQGLSKGLALTAVTTYWGKRGLDGTLPRDVAKAVGLEQHSVGATLLVLAAHAAVAAAVALGLLNAQGRRRRAGLRRLGGP